MLIPIDASFISKLIIKFYSYFLFRHDYEQVDSDEANKMIEMLRKFADDGSLVGKVYKKGNELHQKSYEIQVMDDYSYTDPIDGSVTKKQVL